MFTFLKENNTRSEKALLALFIIVFCQETLFIYPVAILSHLGAFPDLRYVIFPLTYAILVILAIRGRDVTRYIRFSDFCLIVFFAFYVIISYRLDYKQTQAISEALFPEILPCIPFLLFGLCIKIDSLSMDTLGKWCCLAVVVTSVYRLMYQVPEIQWEKNYNMGAAYSLLPNIMVLIDYLFRSKRKIIPLICTVVGLFYLFAMGTRGPIVIVFALLFVRIIFSVNIKKFLRVIMTILFVFFLTWLSTSSSLIYLLASLGNILSSLGLSSRATDFGVSGEFISNTTGRTIITETLLSKMNDLPPFGFGVLGENRFDILYAHNLYIQAFFDYGYLFGSIILLFIITISIRALWKTKHKLMQHWVLIWVVFVFVEGFFGGGILRYEFFMLIGICLRVLRMKVIEII